DDARRIADRRRHFRRRNEGRRRCLDLRGLWLRRLDDLGRRRGRRRNDHLFDDRGFQRLLDDLQALSRGAGDQRPQHDDVDQEDDGPSDHAPRGIGAAELAPVQRGGGGGGAHWTNCSWPITASLDSPNRFDVDSTLANTAYWQSLLGRM